VANLPVLGLSSKGAVDRLLSAVVSFEARLRDAEAYVKEQQANIVKAADELSSRLASSVDPLIAEAARELEEAYRAEKAKVDEDLKRRLAEAEERLNKLAQQNREAAVQAVVEAVKKALSG
jgi:small-conductance mechanosensitive channel